MCVCVCVCVCVSLPVGGVEISRRSLDETLPKKTEYKNPTNILFNMEIFLLVSTKIDIFHTFEPLNSNSNK